MLRDTGAFLKEWDECRQQLEPFFLKTGEKAKLDTAAVLTQLLHLKQALEKLDVDAMDEAMQQIDSFAFPKKLEGDMEQLKVLVAELETEQGVPFIEKLIQKLKYESTK